MQVTRTRAADEAGTRVQAVVDPSGPTQRNDPSGSSSACSPLSGPCQTVPPSILMVMPSCATRPSSHGSSITAGNVGAIAAVVVTTGEIGPAGPGIDDDDAVAVVGAVVMTVGCGGAEARPEQAVPAMATVMPIAATASRRASRSPGLTHPWWPWPSTAVHPGWRLPARVAPTPGPPGRVTSPVISAE